MPYDILLKIMADYLVIPIVLVGGVVLLCVPKAQRMQLWARAVVTGLTALLCAKTMSLLYQGERPFEALGVAPGAAFLPNPGFPSDHALLVFSVTYIVWATTKNGWLSAGLLLASIAVAAGRVMALVHTPLDVIGGMVCALVAVSVVYGRGFFTKKQI
jgi:membrane-associated phospholipid phosphatase